MRFSFRSGGFFLVAATAAIAASGCQSVQPIDHRAATPPPVVDNKTPTTAILPEAAPISLSLDDESATTDDPCKKTEQDKTEILTVYCAKCHSGPADHAQGLPPWNFVLDDGRLISEQFTREQQPPQRYVVPGDPEKSILYVRTAILGDMPPQPTDLGTPRNPAPTLSDFSVLRDWIEHCLPGSKPRGGTLTPTVPATPAVDASRPPASSGADAGSTPEPDDTTDDNDAGSGTADAGSDGGASDARPVDGRRRG